MYPIAAVMESPGFWNHRLGHDYINYTNMQNAVVGVVLDKKGAISKLVESCCGLWGLANFGLWGLANLIVFCSRRQRWYWAAEYSRQWSDYCGHMESVYLRGSRNFHLLFLKRIKWNYTGFSWIQSENWGFNIRKIRNPTDNGKEFCYHNFDHYFKVIRLFHPNSKPHTQKKVALWIFCLRMVCLTG